MYSPENVRASRWCWRNTDWITRAPYNRIQNSTHFERGKRRLAAKMTTLHTWPSWYYLTGICRSFSSSTLVEQSSAHLFTVCSPVITLKLKRENERWTVNQLKSKKTFFLPVWFSVRMINVRYESHPAECRRWRIECSPFTHYLPPIQPK